MASSYPLILLSLVITLSCSNGVHHDKTIPKNHKPKDMCKLVLEKFSQTVSDYTSCISSFARPIELCLRCKDQYLSVGTAYEYMEDFAQDNYTCKEILTKQDRLNVIGKMYESVIGSESLWQLASCNNCYQNNDPTTDKKGDYSMEFEDKWNKAMDCFKKFINQPILDPSLSPEIAIDTLIGYKDLKDKDLCSNCSEIYNSLRSFFWEKVVPSNPQGILSGVCYDIRDRFNLTGQIWKESFDCEPMPSSWKFVLPVVFFSISIILMTYICEPWILPYFFPTKIQETVALVQQDIYDGEIIEASDDFVHGNFEVVPGVSAEEYIQRFQRVNISLPEGGDSTIRIPPPPEDFYDLEWHNDEWVLPPKELILKMNELKQKSKHGEISEKEMDILQCKLILEELNRNKLQKRRNSEMSLLHAQSNEDSNPTFILED